MPHTPRLAQTRRGRRLAVLAVAWAAVLAGTAPALARVQSYRTSDGSEDTSFVKLGNATTTSAVVPDGARGVYLIGNIFVNGGERQVVHLRANGAVDPAFNVQIRGGRATTGAFEHGRLALLGSFTSIGNARREGIAVVDAGSGAPLAWAPEIPPSTARKPPARRANTQPWDSVAFAAGTLAASTDAGVFGWREGAIAPTWTRALALGESPAPIAAWKDALWAVGAVKPQQGQGMFEITPASGRMRSIPGDFEHVDSLQRVGGRLITIIQGRVSVLFDRQASTHVQSCGQIADATAYVTAVTGDARTLYAGDEPFTADGPGKLPAVTACPFSGAASQFTPPILAYDRHGPFVQSIALVGTHVLVLTIR